ncbi:MAG: type IX secretion system membrane protein PorP/SprF [Flavobacteriales bacterium]|nr:type IX secretion system membrane protein PorP/SprF [Flavobacteriales bacterium]MBK6944060.1 type IX secretion system membrane protein PorP/SprF [Flavobacteriales bacterium]MBK7240264.1 type IX secretion system membrane protein PorP/SprF [Flavobacteriales bacterium]MBK7295450.1 type IX secretion system membrane protein PorP/SprF [Flavobacteriales bacterium]MBK9533728.1 type IX secretion system membrane protein PorP/SprF [Flavobacteriales bacterium]
MRGALIVCIVMLVGTVGCAQQLSQYTQYVFNQFSINPAVAGSKDCLDVRLGFRQQWVGLPGAPTTGWASLHASLKGKNKPFQNNKHGIGMFVEADQAGNWGYTRFLLAYAYHIQMSKDYYMALGVFAGVQQMKFDVGEAFLSDAGDPALDGKATSLVVPDISPGIWVYGKRFWGGLALQQALGNKIKNIGTSSKLARHFKLSAGYRFKLGTKMSFTPSTMFKVAEGSPVALDVNAMIEWNRVIALGIGYRNGDALTLMMKVGFLQFFQLGYSYDVTTSRLREGSSNTHEIILGVTPCSKAGKDKRMINCPAFD